MKDHIAARLAALRREMKARGIDIYYIPSNDNHCSEYTGAHFQSREYISGFTGSAGTAVITHNEAGLWTDSRYFIQAEQQLEGTEFTLYRSGEKDVPTTLEYIGKTGGVLGFDGKCVPEKFAAEVTEALGEDNIRFVDLVDIIWENRPPVSKGRTFTLDIKYSGEESAHKLKHLREKMTEKKADIFLTAAPDEICWLLNVRGDDIPYNPVILSYAAVTAENVLWFVDGKKAEGLIIPDEVKVLPYDDFYRYIADIPEGKTVLLDKNALNSQSVRALKKGVKVISEQSPVTLFKAVKNNTEIENLRCAHKKDGIAVRKFIAEIKAHFKDHTELTAAQLLLKFRKEQEGFIEESFAPIIACGEHGAIVHYSADETTDCPLKADSFLLCDTGGHYYEGTTDITRTICLGKPTAEMKAHYTAVLRGHLALANAKFKKGCTGANLDILAKAPLWEQGLDFAHGTGHGVGYLLNVHELPNAIRMRHIPDRDCVLEEGMVTSDEPGLYIRGRYGIRTESLLLCRQAETTEYGEFLCFENLTQVPFDEDAVDFSLMSEKEKRWFEEYQEKAWS